MSDTTATTSEAAFRTRGPSAATLIEALERYALVLLLIAVVVFFAVYPETSDTFLTSQNIRNIVANESVVGIAALAALVPLVALQVDISVGAVLGLVGLVVAKLTVDSGWALGTALLAGLAVGAAIGVANGLLIARIGASSFITTLGITTLIGGLASLYSHDETIVGVPQSLLNFGNQTWLGVPRPTWLLIVVAAGVAYLLRYTVTGRQLLYIGSNPASARLVGVRVERLVFGAFVLSALIAAVAGLLQLARTGSGNPQIGTGLTLNALAACFLGSTTIRPGQFNVPGTLVGVFFVAVSVNGLTLAGAADWVEPAFNGAAVIVAVAIATVLARRRGLRGSAL
jgi:ribose transport system permease protein